MSWNYRVIESGGQFAVHEVFYRPDGTIEGWTETPVFPRGESLEELREDLVRYERAFTEPVLVVGPDGKVAQRG